MKNEFKWEWSDLLLLDTKENATLKRFEVAFSTLINYVRELFEFLWVIFRHALAEITTGRCS